jgi:hypothetical protein
MGGQFVMLVLLSAKCPPKECIPLPIKFSLGRAGGLFSNRKKFNIRIKILGKYSIDDL